MQIPQMLSQVLKSQNPMQMISNLVGGNPQYINMYNQMQNMSKEQQAQKLADLCNQKGITLDQLKNVLGR